MRRVKVVLYLIGALASFIGALVIFKELPAELEAEVGGKTMMLAGMVCIGIGLTWMAWTATRSS